MSAMPTPTTLRPVQVVRRATAVPPAANARWPLDDVAALFELPFNDLIFRDQQVHREHFDANEVQLSTLLSIKTGGCEEDCGYCPQSVRYDTGVEASRSEPLRVRFKGRRRRVADRLLQAPLFPVRCGWPRWKTARLGIASHLACPQRVSRRSSYSGRVGESGSGADQWQTGTVSRNARRPMPPAANARFPPAPMR
jgi:hypothetical protein